MDEREDDELEKDFDEFPGIKGKKKGAAFNDDDPVDVDDTAVLDDATESLEALAEIEDEDEELDEDEADQW